MPSFLKKLTRRRRRTTEATAGPNHKHPALLLEVNNSNSNNSNTKDGSFVPGSIDVDRLASLVSPLKSPAMMHSKSSYLILFNPNPIQTNTDTTTTTTTKHAIVSSPTATISTVDSSSRMSVSASVLASGSFLMNSREEDIAMDLLVWIDFCRNG